METKDVRDRDSLEAYLNALPDADRRAVAVRVAYRAAARVLPVAARDFLIANWARERDLTPIAIFGAIAVSGGYAVGHPPETDAARAAARAAANAANAAADAAFAAARAAANAAFAADAVANAADAADAVANAADAVAKAADAAFAADADLWPLIQTDLQGDTGSDPLWPDGLPRQIADSWTEAKRAMQHHAADWSFWINWYERVRDGKNWHPAEVVGVLNQITKDDWDEGPAHINPKFDKVLELYASDIARTGEVIQVDQDGQFFARAVTALPKDLAEEVVDRVGDAIQDFRAEIGGNQSYLSCMVDVIATLERWLDWYADRPLRLYEKLADAMDRIAEIARENGLDADAQIAVLLREIERSRTDLRANDPQIEERIKSRVRVRYAEMAEPSKELFLGMIKSGAAASEPKLKQEMLEDLPTIEDENAPNDEKERALVREAERTTQMAKLDREKVVQTAKDASTVIKAGEGVWELLKPIWGLFF